MVLRLNEREANPNPHINFITALPARARSSSKAEEDAKELLRALAAQVKPIMKAHGFSINSFEEYEYNNVFAGRNWNAGEVVELVLRRADGTFYTIPTLLNVLCHEIAHIKHMNHLSGFQKLWAQLRSEVQALRARGYYGDGYWSSGARVGDGARTGGIGSEFEVMPEYVCGGAQTRQKTRTVGRRRHKESNAAGPSLHTGAQTEKKRKSGSRITAKDKFTGTGKALNEDVSDEDKKKIGTGFRKKANSQKAKLERAEAAERRLRALQGTLVKTENIEISSDEEGDFIKEEDDSDRRRFMADIMSAEELDTLKCSVIGNNFTDSSDTTGTEEDRKSSTQLNTKRRPDTELPTSQPSTKKPKLPQSQTKKPTVKNETAPAAASSSRPIEAPRIRPSSKESPVDLASEWSCSTCTYINPGSDLSCEMCNTIRD
ncbi:WLM-domain-containing protein [Sistotremastrum suecicum HHB10207 ss-3]|uniref:WLM-domain-containing protein n=1 Tax=Sistotremastrum suecicum HHB10207 ss-3 TaxID=1314776 RepID=A0A166E0X4_9AGAM|nr:WLM-domain-containing protein [Sistotremastrum suecicum HHB10207 ss-3]